MELFTVSKIISIVNNHRSVVYKRLQNITPTKRKKTKGGYKNYYSLSDLPEDYRAKIMAAQSLVPVSVKNMETRIQVGNKVLTVDNLPEKQKKIGLARAELIEAYSIEKIALHKNKATCSLSVFIDTYNNGNFLPHIYKVLGPVNKKTYYKWSKLYNDKGIAGVTPKHGAHLKGTCKIREDEKKILLEEFLNPNKPSIASSINYMRLRLAHGEKPSTTSTRTLQRWLSNYTNKNYDKVILMREGEKALNDKVLPYRIRDKFALSVGEVIVADGKVLNFLIKDPSQKNKPVRMTLVTFIDWRSGYPVGISIMPTENVYNIHTALYNAINNLGFFPKVVYLDNGRAFKAKIFTSKQGQSLDFNKRCVGLYLKFLIKVILAKPYHGQSKIVERFFKELLKFEQQMASYIGNSIDNKPAKMMRNEKWHQKQASDYVPTISEATEMLNGWFKNIYGQTESKGLKESETPYSLYMGAKKEGMDPVQLAISLAPEERRLVGRNGVELFGIKYFHETLYGLREYVKVKYFFNDLKKVYVFDESNNYICTAEAVESKNPIAVLDKESYDYQDLKNDMRIQNSLKRATKKAAELQLNDKNPNDTTFFDIIGTPAPGENQPKLAKQKELPSMITRELPGTIEHAQPEEEEFEMPLLDGMEKYIYLLQHGLESSDPKFIEDFEQTELWETTYGSETGQIRLSQIRKNGQEVRTQKQMVSREKKKTSAATPV